MNDTITADVQTEEIVANVAPEAPVESDQQTGDETSNAPDEGGAEETANVAKSEDRYPEKPVRKLLAERLAAAHDAGWTRPRLTELIKQVNGDAPDAPSDEPDGFYMGGSALFRTRNGNVHAGEVKYLTAVLDWIDAGVVQLPEKVTKNPAKLQERLAAFEAQVASLQAALDGVRQAAEASSDVKGVGALREVLADIAKIASGDEGDQA
jgi:hypothetical protein